MIIRSERELALFEETLGQCQNTVWLISTCGKQYDLKNPLERCLGIAEMLKYQSAEEPEVFTTSYGDDPISPLSSMEINYDNMPDGIPCAMGRRIDADHTDMMVVGDGYLILISNKLAKSITM